VSENEPAPEAEAAAAAVDPPPLIDTPEIGELFERSKPLSTFKKIIERDEGLER
jgi:hypothetical protein